MPKVSVIITSYQKPVMVIDCINSVLSQTCQDFEILLIDDNSSEETVSSIYKFLPNPKIRFFRTWVSEDERPKRVRYAYLISEAMKIAEGEIICFLSDDDLFLPNKLQRVVEFFGSNPDKHIVYGKQHLYDYDHATRTTKDRGVRHFPGTIASGYGIADHSSVCVRKSLTDQVGGWPDDPQWWMNADAQYWSKLAATGNKMYGINEELDVHRFHQKSTQAIGVPRKTSTSPIQQFFKSVNHKPFEGEMDSGYSNTQKDLHCYIRTFQFNVLYTLTQDPQYLAVVEKAVKLNNNNASIITKQSYNADGIRRCDFVLTEEGSLELPKLLGMLDNKVWYFVQTASGLDKHLS